MSIIFQPFDVMRTRVVLNSEKYKGFFGVFRAARDVAKAEGPGAFYKGSGM